MLQRYATLLVDYCLDVREGESVLINVGAAAADLARLVHNDVLARGAWPIMRLTYPGQVEDYLMHAKDRQLDHASKAAQLEINAVDAWLRIASDTNTRGAASAPPERLARLGRAQAAITRTRLTKKWCGTLYPTPAYAQDAGMPTDEFETFVWRAMMLDTPDPKAAWLAMHAEQQALVDRLNRAKVIRIQAEGADLTLRVDARLWQNSSGRRNMPSGEVFTSPLEDSANGVVRFTVPSSVSGRDVRDVTLNFTDGLVTKARAEVGNDYLQAAINTDAGAKFLGEIGIGTNRNIQRPTRNILFDEKISGTVHLALGNSYPETGGKNISGLHWDLILDMRAEAGGGQLSADGDPVSINGLFV